MEANPPQVLANFQMQVSEMLAQAYLRAGTADRAVSTLDEALSRSELAGIHSYDASLHRLNGEAILMRDSSMIAQAEACFRKGIGIAGAGREVVGATRHDESRDCSRRKASAMKHPRCSPTSAAGSPRASTLLT